MHIMDVKNCELWVPRLCPEFIVIHDARFVVKIIQLSKGLLELSPPDCTTSSYNILNKNKK